MILHPSSRARAPLAVVMAVVGCNAGAEPPPETRSASSIDFETVADVLVERLALQPGERVLLVGLPGRFDPLVPLLRKAVVAAGAEDLGAWSVGGTAGDGWGTAFTDEIARVVDRPAALRELLAGVDAGVMLPGAAPGQAVYAALQDVLRSGRGRTVHFHWLGAYDLEGAERAVDETVDLLYQRALAETQYDALARTQAAFEEAMRGALVRVTTPAGTDLSFRIGDRPVTRQDGDASAARAARARNLIDREVELPAGAIRVAPVESTVNGRIVFPPSPWRGERVERLTLTFEDGRVVDASAESGLEAALDEMDAAGEAGRAFRELALGFNPLLAIPEEGERWIPYYGYGAGVVRLSLGDNTELGGAVAGPYVRWNFFVDATVRVDGETWVRDGRLLR